MIPEPTALPDALPAPDPAAATAPVRERMPFSLYLVEIYLFFEYLRLADVVPGIAPLRLPFLVTILLTLLVLPRLQESLHRRQTLLFGALLAMMAFWVPVATNNYWALQFFMITGNMAVAYLAITQVVTTLPRLQHLIRRWLLIQALLALWGLTHHGTGPGGFVGDENDYGLVIDMMLPFPLFLLLSAGRAHRRARLLALLAAGIGAAFATFSRGTFLGLLAVGAYAFAKSSRKLAILVTLAFCVLVGSLAAPPSYYERISSIWGEATGETQGTGAERKYEWGIGITMFLNNPIFGVGQGNFPWRFAEYQGNERWKTRSLAGRAAHSLYVTLFTELGLVGASIFFGMIWLLRADLRAVRERLRRAGPKQPDADYLLALTDAVSASLLAFLITGAFISVLYYPPIWLLMALGAALRRVALGGAAAPADGRPAGVAA